jgi:predicted RND superfamily exporter protein
LPPVEGLASKVATFLERHSGAVALTLLVLTGLLFIPMFALSPKEQASGEPGGAVFDLRDEVDDLFPPRTHPTFLIVEARNGDMLSAEPLRELYRNEQKLRQSAIGQEYLYRRYDADLDRPVHGLFTMADAVRAVLRLDPRLNTTLEAASDEQVKLAVHQVLASPEMQGLRGSLSQMATVERRVVAGQEIDYWASPALLVVVTADNEKLGGGSLSIMVGGGPGVLKKERFNRDVQALLRGDQKSFRLWGVAIDINLESQDEGRTAVPFIMATVVGVLAVVGISLRSVRTVLLTALGLGILIVWLKGVSNIIGLKSSLILDLIVPIAMISLGVDYAIHAQHRYREESYRGQGPRRAFVLGFRRVLGALVLAMLTTTVAFLANIASGIEMIIGFGIGAGMAVVFAFLILGIFVPLLQMRLDARRGATPAWTVPQGDRVAYGNSPRPIPDWGGSRRGFLLVSLIPSLARRRVPVLVVTGMVTLVALFFALKLEPQMDAKEFFNPRSDFVVGLDKLDEHMGQTTGEPAIIYIRGELSHPEVLRHIKEWLGSLRQNPYVGKDDEGEISIQGTTLFILLKRVVDNEYARRAIQSATGVEIVDADGDGLPDTQAQIKAAYDYMVEHGIPLNERALVYDRSQIRETLYYNPGEPEAATQILVGLPGTREQSVVAAARQALIENIWELEQNPRISFAGLTGSPFIREAILKATSRSLMRSFPIAVVGCFLLVTLAMRSLKFGIVTVIPIGLVVAWLYAFMYLMGYHLNFVTATIAAVSMGVGIDYSIHMTQRFRQELVAAEDKVQALKQATSGTGVALTASAASSILGFAIMSFAPMPMFSTYGILTATMILMAAVAALLVLPSLLLLVTPGRSPGGLR